MLKIVCQREIVVYLKSLGLFSVCINFLADLEIVKSKKNNTGKVKKTIKAQPSCLFSNTHIARPSLLQTLIPAQPPLTTTGDERQ